MYMYKFIDQLYDWHFLCNTIEHELELLRAFKVTRWMTYKIFMPLVKRRLYSSTHHNPSHAEKNNDAEDVDHDCRENSIPSSEEDRLIEQKISESLEAR